MKLLVTAFEPFGGETLNPALEALNRLGDSIDTVKLIRVEVPTSFKRALGAVKRAIEAEEGEKPCAVLMLGQAGGRSALTPERVAINIASARIPDNDGFMPFEEPIVPGGPAAYFSTLPIVKLTEAIREAGLPAAISNSAGTFVCNSLMYGVLHWLESEHPAIKAGFMHVPYAPEQTAAMTSPQPSMSIQDIARGVEAALRALIMNIK